MEENIDPPWYKLNPVGNGTVPCGFYGHQGHNRSQHKKVINYSLILSYLNFFNFTRV